ncbi:glycosyltransferase [Brevundimonas sp.]|uniref:glycosyltransferase n=1 Tax=Brevundimonas sp. TaxID=1871086 RepID=UPI003D6CCE45
MAAFLTFIVGLVASTAVWPSVSAAILILMQLGFLIIVGWRLLTVIASQRPVAPPPPAPRAWPRYSVIVALHDEAPILPHLVERLAGLDYPTSLLDGYLVLEAHDQATIDAARALDRPDWLHILVIPPGVPTTKPRALNHALAVARGDILTVYDAEDDPDPLQLQEAAARFAVEDEDLVCLQAPLRIRRLHKGREASPFLDRHFAAEYAALFEITLPAMARMRLPFPLGGTSNHFRVSALRALGGWDAWNVTEDADLGFRIWRRGWRLGVLSRPTFETPPGRLVHWLPQRTRWLKGYMQTLSVHTRSASGMGWRGWSAMTLTLGAAVASAALHAMSVAWIGLSLLIALLARQAPQTPWLGLGVLLTGAAAAVLTTAIGARRANTPFSVWDWIAAPAYWSLLSLAFVHALIRLIVEPHRWDKTPHRPDVAPEVSLSIGKSDFADAGRAAA